MAIDYTNLFQDVGEFVEAVNLFVGWSVNEVPGMATEIIAELAGNVRYDVAEGVDTTFQGYRDQLVGWAEQMGRKVEERLTNRDTVIEELPLSSGAGIGDVLIELMKDMIVNGESINQSTVTIGSVTADPGNVGDVTVLTSKVLDGATQPGSDMASYPSYAGLDSELAGTETITITCMSDSPSDGVTANTGEQFQVRGGAAGQSPFDWRSEGSGEGATIGLINASGLVTDGEFEEWGGTGNNTPTSWTIDTGTAGTHVFRESSGASVKQESYALRITGITGFPTIQVSQDTSEGLASLVPLKRYCVACWVLGNASIAAGALTIEFEGTGYSPAVTEQIVMDTAALAAATSYTLKSFFITMPADIPTDLALVIKTTGTLTNGQSVRIDGLALGEVTYQGGIGLVLVGGATKALREDRYTFDVSNDGAGVFQEFFRRWLKVQLPSDGSPTIADSLAT